MLGIKLSIGRLSDDLLLGKTKGKEYREKVTR